MLLHVHMYVGESPPANLAKGEIPRNDISKFSINILKDLE